jgi:1-deoxy-D-xylulose-5-phosphate synthase
VSPFNPKTGKKVSNKKKQKTYTDTFGDWINQKAKKDKNLHAVTPAMCEGSGLSEFREKFPERYYDVGIAEQHAVTFAAGLACEGKKPVVAIYSTFLQRAYDQLIHDVAIQKLNVMLAVDRAGIVGPDGATHAGSFDFSFLRCVPNIVVMAAADINECTRMLDVAYEYDGPTVVRFPRGSGEECIENNETDVKIGKGQIVRHGRRIAVLAFGAMVERCLLSAKELGVTVANMRFVKPLDVELLESLAKTHDVFVTVEDNAVAGGAGSGVNEFVLNKKIDVQVQNIGLADEFTVHGTRDEVLDDMGLSQEKIMKFISKL